MKVVAFDGTVLDATFVVHQPADGAVPLVFESSGGHTGGPNPRNLQYRQGLSVLLRRLQQINAVVQEVRVETARTRVLPVEQQRVVIPHRSFPVHMRDIGDVEEFRVEISRYGRKVGQSPDLAAEGGGSSRRLRMLLTGVAMDRGDLERYLAGRGVEADSDSVTSVVGIAAGKARGGQGFLVSRAVRKVIEERALAVAISYYREQGWHVADVGITQSYDLRCTNGEAERRVEVKGTTGLGETVILTRNEVQHARDFQPNVDLLVVTEIRVEGRDGDNPVATGGKAYVCPGWCPADEDLTPFGYDYSTGLGDAAAEGWQTLPEVPC